MILKVFLGTSDEFYHDGSHSYVLDNGTGDLEIALNSIDTKGDSETCAAFNVDGASELYYDNSKKFETTSSGVKVSKDNTQTALLFMILIRTNDNFRILHNGGGTQSTSRSK